MVAIGADSGVLTVLALPWLIMHWPSAVASPAPTASEAAYLQVLRACAIVFVMARLVSWLTAASAMPHAHDR